MKKRVIVSKLTNNQHSLICPLYTPQNEDKWLIFIGLNGMECG